MAYALAPVNVAHRWEFNVLLALFSLPLQGFAIWQFDRDNIAATSFFHGWYWDTLGVVLVQAVRAAARALHTALHVLPTLQLRALASL